MDRGMILCLGIALFCGVIAVHLLRNKVTLGAVLYALLTIGCVYKAGVQQGFNSYSGKFLYKNSLESCVIYEVRAAMPVQIEYSGNSLYTALIRKEGDKRERKPFIEYRDNYSFEVKFTDSKMYLFRDEEPPDRFMKSKNGSVLVPYPPNGYLEKALVEECLKK